MWTIRGRHTGALRLADRMRRHGVNVQPIVHPAVDDNAARLRFFVNATHTQEQLRTTVEHVRAALIATATPLSARD
jgi:7-keto-8-aminopelargonate synthetase-like enzyme